MLHRSQCLLDQRVQLPAQQRRPVLYHLTGAACRKFLVLKLLFYAGKLHVGTAFTGSHQRRRPNKTGQLITGKQHLFHLVLRCHISADLVPVAANDMDHRLSHTGRTQQLRRLQAMLFGVHLKINVMQKTAHCPKIGVNTVAQIISKPAHDGFHRQGVL